MSEHYLDYLNKDTIPPDVLARFVDWCVWQQARPALVEVLERVGMSQSAHDISHADDFARLQAVCHEAHQLARTTPRRTGPLGLSTAEAATNLMERLLKAAHEQDDPEGAAFFSAQMVGWSGFAEASFVDVRRKTQAEEEARKAQEQHLRQLWHDHSKPSE